MLDFASYYLANNVQVRFTKQCPGINVSPPCGERAGESFWRFKAPLRSSLEDMEMKHLFRVLFCLALFCGVASHARGQNFHVQVLDPTNMCSLNPALCTIADPTANFPVAFDTAACAQVPPADIPAGPFGCLVVVNDSTVKFTTLSLGLTAPSDLNIDCPTNLPGSVFADSSCSGSGDTYSVFFSGGAGLPSTAEMIILETGVDPDSVTGTAAVNTPEPDSVLLMATGTMMAGLYLSRRQLAAAFGKAK